MLSFPRCQAWSICRLGLLLLCGCTTIHPPVDRVLRSQGNVSGEPSAVTGCYAICCPDVLDIEVPGHPEWSGSRRVDVDGRINLGTLGRLRVEGKSVPAVSACVAHLIGCPDDQVQVHVGAYRSQQVFLFGQVAGWPRAVAYRGPETVSELLQRVGGITAGAAPEDVYVIRGRVPEGRPPEVFHVDLQAIVARHDGRTDVRLQPFDQVYVGQNRRSTIERCVPPCLQPVYELVAGLYRPNNPQ